MNDSSPSQTRPIQSNQIVILMIRLTQYNVKANTVLNHILPEPVFRIMITEKARPLEGKFFHGNTISVFGI